MGVYDQQARDAGAWGEIGLRPYVLPGNELHGVNIELRTCWSADPGPKEAEEAARKISQLSP